MKEHKLAAIVFTDIVGYTRRMSADEEGTMKLLSRQREIIFPMVKEYGGKVIKEIGDGLMIMFTSANRAVRFAMAVQEKLKDDELTIRAGIHIGDVVFEESDVFGSAVNIAARIEPLAPAGGICISEDVRSQIRNQNDIFTVSIGKKELKGVDGSLEIFRVIPEASYEEAEKLPFFKDLWKRRVLQITGIYLALAYLVRLGIGYMVTEYMLSPYLTNLVWYILLSLIPSIILVSYFHGRKGVSKWTKVEKIGLPLNIIVAFLVLFFVFQGKDLGAITTILTVENEEGVKLEKVVVKNEFRKRIFVFNFKNVSGDTALDHLQYGITEMTEYDLSQDLRITPQTANGIYTRLVEAGYEDAVGLPVTLMKRYAEQRHANYFLFGELDKEGDLLVLDARLFDTKLTRLVKEIIIEEEDIFKMVDRLSIEVRMGMDLPESYSAGIVDLPVSDLLTDSESSIYYFAKAVKANALGNWEDNARYLESIIRSDPDFSFAYVLLAMGYVNLSQFGDAVIQLEKVMDDRLWYKLPERHQFIVKYVYYILQQQPDNALSIVKMWAELYPDDIVAHASLAQRYAIKNMFPEAIEECKKIMILDPEQYQFLETIADYYLQIGNYDSSLVYFNKYATAMPKQAASYINLGDYYQLVGELDSAKENYETANLLADINERIPVKISFGDLLMSTGSFDQAFEQYTEGLSIARSATDSGQIYNALQSYYQILGQDKRALEMHKLKLGIFSRIMSPKDYLSFQILSLGPYIEAGEGNKALRLISEVSKELDPPLDKLIPLAYLQVYAEMGEVEKAKESIDGAKDMVKGFGQEIMMANIYDAQAKIHEAEDEYAKAVDAYMQFYEINPTSITVHTRLARCYRHLGEFEKAEKEIEVSLKNRPYNPFDNYEAALLYLEMNDSEKAKEHFERATYIWKDADDDHEKASLAKEKLSSMQ